MGGACARGWNDRALHGVGTLPSIAAALIACGRSPDTPAAAVQWGTHPHQRTVTATLATLADEIAAQGVSAPVITVIGDVVALRDEIGWFDTRPLFGKRVVVTRARSQAASLSERLRTRRAGDRDAGDSSRGDGSGPLRSALARLPEYGWAVFTSQNAVRIFWDPLRAEDATRVRSPV